MTVTIQWDSDEPITGQPDEGTESKVYTESGPGTVTITDEAIGGDSRTLSYSVPLPLTSVVPDPAEVDSAGTETERTITVAGEGFPANRSGTVTVAMGPPDAIGGTVVATGATTNAAGIFTDVTLIVPADTDAGDYHLQATFGDIADLSAALTVVNTELVAPTGLDSPEQGANTVDLTWDAVPEAEQYVVRWSTAGDEQWTEQTPVGTTADTVSGLQTESPYDFQVKATATGSTDSPWSTPVFTVSTTPQPQMDTPTGLEVGTTTSDSIALSWNAVTTPVEAETYTLAWRGPDDIWNEEPDIETPNFTVESLDPDTEYDFRVRALAGAHTDSDWSTIVPGTTEPLGQMDTPTNLTDTATTATTVDLGWDDVTTPVAAESYGVEQSDDSGTTWNEVQNVAVSEATVEGLTSGETYDFRVIARAADYSDSTPTAAHTVTLP